MKKQELEQLIREVVQKELKQAVKKYVQLYAPIVVKEMVDEMIEQTLNEHVLSKQTAINESQEYPTLGNKVFTSANMSSVNRNKFKELLGYGDINSRNENTIDKIVTDTGAEIPVNPDLIPESLKKALNTNYSEFLKKMNSVPRTHLPV